MSRATYVAPCGDWQIDTPTPLEADLGGLTLGELVDALRDELRDHVADCPDCQTITSDTTHRARWLRRPGADS